MKTSRITNYDPLLSVEENAANNNVTVATMRYFIKTRGIDRATDKKIAIYNRVWEYRKKNTEANVEEIAKALGFSQGTVRKYLATTEPPKPKEKKDSSLRKANQVHFLSVSENQSDILKSILAIHLPGRDRFDCDLTAWKCGFYTEGLLRPHWLFDKYPQMKEVTGLDDIGKYSLTGALKSVVIDLPTTVEVPSTKRVTIGTSFSSMEELYGEHDKMLKLGYELLRSDGILIYKTMDFTYNNATMWVSDFVLRLAQKQGFVLADKYILIDSKHAKIDRRRTRYTTSVPSHAYFFVFRKREQSAPGESQINQGL